jgi:hypothetical protein
MEIDSRKPKEWVRITNEPNCKFATTHVCVLILKGLVRLHYLALVLLCFALSYHVYFVLHCPIFFCLTLPCLAYLVLGHAN